MSYVDGYVLAVPKKKLAAYKKMAKEGGPMWMKHGALRYVEASGDDLAPKWGVPFTKIMHTKPTETVVFAFVVYKSRIHRDQVNAKVMKEMEAAKNDQHEKSMPFDMKRMAFGGFEVMVEL